MADSGEKSSFVFEMISSPLNLALLTVCGYLLYKIFGSRRQEPPKQVEPSLPKLKKRDMTLEEIRPYDGKTGDGRIIMAANGKLFDMTRGKKFYGPGGPYSMFAGRDASRGLATFSLEEESVKDDYDDLSDLNSMQMESLREWEMQFTEKYDYVGRLIKPGESPQDYSETEDEQSHEKSKDE